jgi:hypothetical protein
MTANTEIRDALPDHLPVLQVTAVDVIVAFATSILSLAVLWCGTYEIVSLAEAGLLHVAVLCIPAIFLAVRRRRRGELTIPALLLIATFAGGPIGAAGTSFTAIALWLQRPTPVRLKGWYDYIAGVVVRGQLTEIHDDLSSGRLPPDPAASVPRYAPILTGASLVEQQRVLGVVGRRYHSEFRPVLRRALRNRNGLIRTQAAAIASGLALDEKTQLWSGEAMTPRNPAGRV